MDLDDHVGEADDFQPNASTAGYDRMLALAGLFRYVPASVVFMSLSGWLYYRNMTPSLLFRPIRIEIIMIVWNSTARAPPE